MPKTIKPAIHDYYCDVYVIHRKLVVIEASEQVALLIASALEIINPDNPSLEILTRNLALAIQQKVERNNHGG